MNADAGNGKKFAVIIGIYLVVKSVLNGIIGSFVLSEVLFAIAILAFLVSGIKFVNYIVAVVMVVIVAKNFGYNISDIGANWIYLAEAALDVGAAVLLVFNSDVKEFFSGKKPEN